MDDKEEQIFDKEQWKKEAEAVINDVKDCVKEIFISDSIPSSNSCIVCNLTTFEGNKYCIELTAAGFRVVGDNYDDSKSPSERFFETPYSLLDSISPAYRESFSSSLVAKLTALQDAVSKE